MSEYRNQRTRSRRSSREPVQRTQRTRKRLPYTYLLIGFILIYIVAQFVIFMNRDTTNYVVAKQGDIVETFSTQGVVIRSEQLVTAHEDGIVQYYYPGGKELMKDTLVCTLLDDYYGNILDEKIDELYEQIQDVDTGEYEDAFDSLDEDIAASIASFLRSRQPNNYDALYNLQGDLQSAVSKRKDMYSLMSNTKVTALLQQQGIYTQEQNKVISNMYLQEGGVIDYSYDKYEGWNVDQVGPDFIQNYDSHYNYFEINMQKVSAGTTLYRLVSSQVWYIVIYLDSTQAEYFSGESTISFIYNSSQKLNGYVDTLEVYDEDSGTYKLVIKLTTRVQDFMNDRIADLVFTKNSHSGLKISESCLVEQDCYVLPQEYIAESNDLTGVLAVNGDDIRFAALDILLTDKGLSYFLLPEYLSPGTMIQKPNSSDRMSLGQTSSVSGVYVVNGGYEEFKIVSIVYRSQGYAIVEGIQMYDRVKVGVSK